MSTANSFTHTEAERVFSRQRLEQLRKIYGVEDEKLLELHARLGLLSGSIYASVSLFEVHFRNIIMECMDQNFGPNWMDFDDPNLNLFKGVFCGAKVRAQSNIYSKKPYPQRKALKVANIHLPESKRKAKAIRSISVTRTDIVPHLHFSFWRKLFIKPYEHHLWRRGLRKVFPSAKVTRGSVSEKLEICHKVRNRISHNEFVHPELCLEYIDAIEFLTTHLGYGDQSINHKISLFHKPYITKIQDELESLQNFLK